MLIVLRGFEAILETSEAVVHHNRDIHLKNLNCSENVTTLDDCEYELDVSDCNHFEDLRIQCVPIGKYDK